MFISKVSAEKGKHNEHIREDPVSFLNEMKP